MLSPTLDRIFVSVKQSEGVSASGIVLPSRGDAENIGTVVAAGEGKTYSNGDVIPLTVKVGDRIMFNPNSGQTVSIDGEELLVMREDDIFAIIGDEL